MNSDFYRRTTLGSGSSPMPTELPSEIGGYKIESILNRGGMSLLYLGLHPKTHAAIALKVLSKKYVTHPEMINRFLKEASIISLTNHPNIVKLYGQGEWQGGLYIAMEFIQGISLREMILQEAMSLKKAVDILLQIAYALTHLHAHGIIHRDLKPENILLTAQGGVKVIDFGISQIVDENSKLSTAHPLGTPVYMSPEQKSNPLAVDFRTDIFSLGIIAYELILGRLSHGIIHLSLVPQGLQKILAKALQPDRKERYEDIVDFIVDLSNYLHSDHFKKDRRGTDYLGELCDDLKEAQELLISPKIPSWPRLDIALVSNCNTTLSSVYYDFFQRPDGAYQIAMGESLTTGVGGLLQVAMLKGMVRSFSLTKERPLDLVSALNHALFEHEQKTFSFSLLTLYPQDDHLSYISCGYSPLWYIPNGSTEPRRLASDNPSLGSIFPHTFVEVDNSWHIDDKFVLHMFQAGQIHSEEQIEKDEQQFLEALKETLFLMPKPQTESIFRKISRQERKTPFENPVTIITAARIT